MAGHNKWSKVKHIHARVDAIKGRIFSECAHETALAARVGSGDSTDHAVGKGTAKPGRDATQEISHQGCGPTGIAFVTCAMTTPTP